MPRNYPSVPRVKYQFECSATLLKQVTARNLPSYAYKLPEESVRSCVKVNFSVSVK